MAEPTERDEEVTDEVLAGVHGKAPFSDALAVITDYRCELHEQHRRELAGAEQAGFERGRREALRRDHG